jgi:uncharacterized surface protein with fasciclin (FAS1) repeats
MKNRHVRLATTLAATTLSLSTISAISSSALASATSQASSPPVTTMVDFGPGCKAVPMAGAGSFTGMTKAPVATAASHNPVLSTLVSAVEKAGLVDTLNNAKALTVLAPDNAAFAAVPQATLKSLLADKAELTKLLEYHVIAGRLSPAQLVGVHRTIEGETVSVAGTGTRFNVNGTSEVVCGNVQTANATVYIVSSVLNPSA